MSIATVTTRIDTRKAFKDRAADDWYVEPEYAVDALFDAETFDNGIYDPAAGCGTIPRVAARRGLTAVASDLRARAGGERSVASGVDFLQVTMTVPNVVTNPPFKLAEQFVRHGLTLARLKVAILCRLSFLEGRKRRMFFAETGLSRVWVFSRRISMPPGELLQAGEIKATGGAVAFAWFVWDRDHKGATTVGWLP